MIVRLVDLDRFDYPFEVVNAVLGPGHQAVAEQIIHPIDIELRRDELGQGEWAKITANDRRDVSPKLRRISLQLAADLGLIAQYGLDRKILVMKI